VQGKSIRQADCEIHFMLITNLTHFFNVFISLLYMFRVTQCLSSGESIVSIHHVVYSTLCGWPSGMQVSSFLTCIPDGHLHRVICARWCIDTIDSPDGEHWVARNMYRNEINTLKKCVMLVINVNCTEMHGQQNITFCDIHIKQYKCALNWKSCQKK